MLRRIGETAKEGGRGERLWFNSPDMDLVIWLDDRGELDRFQLSWDRGREEKALTWDHRGGFEYGRVLDGEGNPGKHKAAPLLVGGDPPERDVLVGRFAHEADALPEHLRGEILARLETLPAIGGKPAL